MNWSQSALNNRTIFSLTFSGNNIFAGTGNSPIGFGGVYISTNNGTSWTQTALNNRTVNSLTISGNNIFAGINSPIGSIGIYMSTNNGLSWKVKNEGLNGIPSKSLFIANNYIFAGTYTQSVWRRSLIEIIGIQNISAEIPSKYLLSQNYPNPFNPTTNIKFAIPKASIVKITIFDIAGKELETLVNEQLQSGTYQIEWNASNYSSGVYFYKITAGEFSETKRLILLK